MYYNILVVYTRQIGITRFQVTLFARYDSLYTNSIHNIVTTFFMFCNLPLNVVYLNVYYYMTTNGLYILLFFFSLWFGRTYLLKKIKL